MKNIEKKMIQVSGIATAAIAVTLFTTYTTTKYLVNIALDREVPKTMKKVRKLLSGSRADQVYVSELKNAAEALAERENEVVKIVGHDGTTLIGHWIPKENAKRIIIAMHGWRSSWCKDFGMIADFWASNDCSVLYVEQRSQNNSGGDYMCFGLMERYDCLDWVRWVMDHCSGELPIYLSGVSMGATTVLMAAGLNLPGNVHGIVADCGFTSPDAIWKHVMNNNLHLPYHIRGEIANKLCKKKIQFRAEDDSTVNALKNNAIPVLLIHGTDDSFVPIEMTYENYKVCTAPKKLFIVPGANHGMSYFVDKSGYEAAVQDFWQQCDDLREPKGNTNS